MRGTRGSFILIGKPNLFVYLQGTMQGLGPFRVAGERLHRGHRVLLQVLHPLHRGVHPCQKGTQYLVQVVIKTITSGLRLSLSSRVVASRTGISCFASSSIKVNKYESVEMHTSLGERPRRGSYTRGRCDECDPRVAGSGWVSLVDMLGRASRPSVWPFC